MAAICAQNQADVQASKRDWKCEFQFFSDPMHRFAKKYEEHLKLCVTDNSWWFIRNHPFMNKYEYGVVQPGLLAITKDNRNILSYTIDVNPKTLGGAVGRPDVQQTWTLIKKGLETNERQFLPDDINLQSGTSVSFQSTFYVIYSAFMNGWIKSVYLIFPVIATLLYFYFGVTGIKLIFLLALSVPIFIIVAAVGTHIQLLLAGKILPLFSFLDFKTFGWSK